jgi:hypothetical protein
MERDVMGRLLVVTSCLLVGVACDFLNGVHEDIEAATAALAVGALVVEAVPPDSEVNWDALDLPVDVPVATARVVALDLGRPDDEGLPTVIEGARVTAGDPPVLLAEDAGQGVYRGTDIDYAPGAIWGVDVLAPGFDEVGHVEVVLPGVADLTIPETWRAGEPMTLDVTGQGFRFLWVFAHDVLRDEVLFNNLPPDLADLPGLRFREDATTLRVPADGFPEDSYVALGVTGLVFGEPGATYAANGLVSTAIAGRSLLALVRVGNPPPLTVPEETDLPVDDSGQVSP